MRIFTIWRFNRIKKYLNFKTSIYRHINSSVINKMSKTEYADFKQALKMEENWSLATE